MCLPKTVAELNSRLGYRADYKKREGVNKLGVEQIWENMFKGGSLWAGLISGAIAQIQDTVSLTSGKMETGDFAVNSTKNVTMALGTMAGVECGAMLGTVVMPGIGTMIGSILGGVVGDRLGATVGVQAGKLLFNAAGRQAEQSPSMVQLPQ